MKGVYNYLESKLLQAEKKGWGSIYMHSLTKIWYKKVTRKGPPCESRDRI